MKSAGERSTIKDLMEKLAPRGDAVFRHCEARLWGPWQQQVYGEWSMYLSR